MAAKNASPTSFRTTGKAGLQRLGQADGDIVAIDRKALGGRLAIGSDQRGGHGQLGVQQGGGKVVLRSCAASSRAAARRGLGRQHRPVGHVVVPFDQGRLRPGLGQVCGA